MASTWWLLEAKRYLRSANFKGMEITSGLDSDLFLSQWSYYFPFVITFIVCKPLEHLSDDATQIAYDRYCTSSSPNVDPSYGQIDCSSWISILKTGWFGIVLEHRCLPPETLAEDFGEQAVWLLLTPLLHTSLNIVGFLPPRSNQNRDIMRANETTQIYSFTTFS